MSQTRAVQTIGDALLDAARAVPDKEFIVFPGARRTYDQVYRKAIEIARSLIALGVKPQDRVGVLLPNCVEFAEWYFGIFFAGATIAPINTRFKTRELEYVCRHSRIKMLVTSDLIDAHTNFTELLDAAIPGLASISSGSGGVPSHPNLVNRVLLGDKRHPAYLSADDFASAAQTVSANDVEARLAGTSVRSAAVLFYTSGTTAMPKGCILSHETFMRQGAATVERMKFQQDERMWLPLPMFHSSATQTLFSMLCCRGTWLSLTHFEAGSALEQVVEEKITTMFPAFPTIIQQLLNHPKYTTESFRSLRTTFNVANPDLLRLMQSKMPHTIQVGGFGMTETAGSISINSPDETFDERCAHQGRPLPGIEVRIVDPETGHNLPPNQRGEIIVRGPFVFDGYDQPESGETGLDENGWFRTGDLGAMNDEGGLSFLGRLKDMLKVGGENVAAIEVESFLSTHPAVSIAQVVGVPDEKYVEVVAAFLELRPGATATEQEIIDFCAGQIARYKIPRYVRFVTEWPMSSTKIQKFKLRDTLCGELNLS
jgi:fatty-acyl-CoA synthase